MIEYLAISLVVVSLFFFSTTTIGILRFPDFYTRMHAAGKGDTLASLVMLLGLSLLNLGEEVSFDAILTSLKIMAIIPFVFLASPTATHAIIDAGYAREVDVDEAKITAAETSR